MTHREEHGDDESVEVQVQENKLTTVLDLVLLSLARTKSVMSQSNEDAAATSTTFVKHGRIPSRSSFHTDLTINLIMPLENGMINTIR